MKKKLVAFLLVAVMTIAATVIPASAANYDGIDYKSAKCDWFNTSGDNLFVFVQAAPQDGYDLGAVAQDELENVYGVVVFGECSDPAATLTMGPNAANTGWSTSNIEPATADGVTYYAYTTTESLYLNDNTYSQFVICNWSGNTYTINGLAVVGKDGSYLATTGTVPATSPLAGAPAAAETTATLPQTGVVSAVAMYALGAALIGGGVVVTKKSRKEN